MILVEKKVSVNPNSIVLREVLQVICEIQNKENVKMAMTSPCCLGYVDQEFKIILRPLIETGRPPALFCELFYFVTTRQWVLLAGYYLIIYLLISIFN